jgi:hypothetical protein
MDHAPALACFVAQRPRGTTALIQAATGMATAARQHERALFDAGLPEGFIESLVAATNALATAVDDKGSARSHRVAATKGLRADERRARRALKVLDALMRAARLPEDVLAEWTAVSRVESVPTRATAAPAAVSTIVPEPERRALPPGTSSRGALALTAGSAESELEAAAFTARKRPWLRRIAVALGGTDDAQK